MSNKEEWKVFLFILGMFAIAVLLPVGHPRFDHAVLQSLHLVRWYAREHVVVGLLPGFFIAGAIAVFVSQAGVMRYLGPHANKTLAYGVASISGVILSVCSCTVLPLFAGIYRMGAGLGPATAFLYSAPAINVLAIILTARALGLELGVARAVGAVLFSIAIGLAMYFIFRNEEPDRIESRVDVFEDQKTRPLWQTISYFAGMIGILVFANWERTEPSGFLAGVYSVKWALTGISAIVMAVSLVRWFGLRIWPTAAAGLAVVVLAFVFPKYPVIPFVVGLIALSIITATGNTEMRAWFDSTWGLTRKIFPLLFIGVALSGFFLGRPGEEGLIPSRWIVASVGGNSIRANFLSSLIGAFMYFSTLTEVPIIQGLIGSGMGKGPALALLLAGPPLSLPSMIALQSVLGTKKTVTYVSLVVVMATISGLIYGSMF
ncbi:MAG TPA: permease [bacterium]|nr:permease [bacterium]HQL60708.1 permease [bacterium]